MSTETPHGGPPLTWYEPPAWDAAELHMLDAAAELIAARGISGLTVAGLAREASVSRPTIYRRWPGTDEIVRATLLRTTMSLIERVGELPKTRAGIAESIARFSRLFREDPLFHRLLARQPELFTRYSLERLGTSQRFTLRWLVTAVEAGQQQGSVRAGEPQQIAVMLLLIAQSATLSYRSVAPLIDEDQLDEQLRFAVDGYLRPESERQ